MTRTATVPSLETQDSETLRAALAVGDGANHETALGGFVVEGQARHARLILCHGAGAGHDSPFLVRLRQQLAACGIQVVALEFGYMATMRQEGRRRPPPRIETLVAELAEWHRALQTLDGETPLWLGGKSIGGRVASLLATQVEVTGLVLCGYPFHPPASPSVCDSITGRRFVARCCCSRGRATRLGDVTRSRGTICRHRRSATSW